MSDLTQELRSRLASTYRIERELGGGGMSRVFLAEEIALGRRVVIKVFPPELAAVLSTDRFEREVRMAAGLQHPHIVPLLAAGRAGDVLYYMPSIAYRRSCGSGLAPSCTLKGERERAAHYYARLLELWRDADPVLQPHVRDVERRLATLVAEPVR